MERVEAMRAWHELRIARMNAESPASSSRPASPAPTATPRPDLTDLQIAEREFLQSLTSLTPEVRHRELDQWREIRARLRANSIELRDNARIPVHPTKNRTP